MNRYFGFEEWHVHVRSLFVWGRTYKLILPFVLVYTNGMTDAKYNVPVFAELICLVYARYTLRSLFRSVILAAGHYKNTHGIYIVGATIHLGLSILAANRWGRIGFTVSTVVAMLLVEKVLKRRFNLLYASLLFNSNAA